MSQEKKRVEESLREFTPRPAPEELRRRVLAAAESSKRKDRFLSPAQRRASAAFGLLIAAAVGGDALLAGSPGRGVQGILAGTRGAAAESEKIDSDLIREIAGRDRNLEKWVAERLAAKKDPARAHRPAAAGERVKPWEVDDVL